VRPALLRAGRRVAAAALLAVAASGAAAETWVIEADGYVDVVAGRVVRPAVVVVDGG
jgi:hypothetical protein